MAYPLDGIFSWGLVIFGVTAVAAAGKKVVMMAVSNPIPYEKRLELERKYGRWAVETAIAVCPRNDLRCIEREARRLYESRTLRR
ncbi:MAG: hypothetical protein N2506_04975 [Dehalococcoidales bacterium]|nr:hypothetical protein [Dehalococcoidales bacterium]